MTTPLAPEELIRLEQACHPRAGEWRCRDIELWPLLRNQLGALGYLMKSSGENCSHPSFFRRFLRRIRREFLIWRESRNRRQQIRNGGHAVAVFVNLRYRLFDSWTLGLLYPIWLQSTDAGLNPLVLEQDAQAFLSRTPRHEESSTILISPWQRDYFKIFGRSTRRRPHSFNVTRQEVLETLRRAATETGINLDEKLLSSAVANAWTNAEYADRKGERIATLLKYAGVKTAFYICAYGSFGYAIAVGCRRAGVVPVEIQHGCEYNQFAYINWSCIPPEGYRVYPDIFWCWTQVEAEQINAWGCRTTRHRAVCGNHPWMDYYRLDRIPTQPEQEEALQARIASCRGRVILLTLQSQPEDLPDYLYEYIRENPEGDLWLVRAHPGRYLEPGYRALEPFRQMEQPDSAIEWHLGTTLPLPLLLKHCHLHITGYSATALEAEQYGIFTIFTSPNADGLFRFIIQSGNGAISDSREKFGMLMSERRNKQTERTAGNQCLTDEAFAYCLEETSRKMKI